MNTPDTDLKSQVIHLIWSVKFGMWVLLFGISFFNIAGAAFLIPRFLQIFHDMLGGKPLPPITAIIVGSRVALVLLSLAIPVVGLVFCRFMSVKQTSIALAVLMATALIQIVITMLALFLPLVSITQSTANG